MKNPLQVKKSIGVYDAKTHFSALVEQVGQGHSIIITKHGKPVAELVPPAVAKRIEARATHLFVSSTSIWEMAIKISLGKLRLPYHLERELPGLLAINRIEVIQPEFVDYQALTSLPFHHRDPFDRLLITQALRRSLVLLSRDPGLDAYGVRRLWA